MESGDSKKVEDQLVFDDSAEMGLGSEDGGAKGIIAGTMSGAGSKVAKSSQVFVPK